MWTCWVPNRCSLIATVCQAAVSGAQPAPNKPLGLGKADKVAVLEIYWPSSGTTQVFRDIDVNQAIEITEFADNYRKLDWKPLPRPK